MIVHHRQKQVPLKIDVTKAIQVMAIIVETSEESSHFKSSQYVTDNDKDWIRFSGIRAFQVASQSLLSDCIKKDLYIVDNENWINIRYS